MADEAPSPVYRPTPARPRRSPTRPSVSYRRSPGAVRAPVRVPVSSVGGAGRGIAAAARGTPWALALSLFLGPIFEQSDAAARSQRDALDQFELDKFRRKYKSGPRSRGRAIVRSKPDASPLYAGEQVLRTTGRELDPVTVSQPTRAPRAVEKPAPLPEPVLQTVAKPALPPAPTPTPVSTPQAKPWWLSLPLHLPSTFPLELPQIRPFSGGEGSPLLTAFKPPGVGSEPTPFPSPVPLPEPNPRRRCECKPEKKKPGKGYFRVSKAGTETRKYWQDRGGSKGNVIQFPRRK